MTVLSLESRSAFLRKRRRALPDGKARVFVGRRAPPVSGCINRCLSLEYEYDQHGDDQRVNDGGFTNTRPSISEVRILLSASGWREMPSTDLAMAMPIPIAPAAASPTVRPAAKRLHAGGIGGFRPRRLPSFRRVAASAAQATEVNAISSVASAKIKNQIFLAKLSSFSSFSLLQCCASVCGLAFRAWAYGPRTPRRKTGR